MIAFLDACAVIYWVEMASPGYQQFVDKLQNIRHQYGAISFAVSHLSLLECQVKPLRDNNQELFKRYNRFFHASNLLLVPITIQVIEQATLLRAKYNVATPDALQAASAMSISDDVIFLTGDSAFKKISQLNVQLI